MERYDFEGWATRNDLKCSDGRTIRRDAFAEQDGEIVPLMWQHRHESPGNVIGHALLENRPEGVYTYATFNDNPMAIEAKNAVMHGDIRQMSIYANSLRQTPAKDVMHGVIREVSLVIAGANPGAYIQALDIRHSDDPDSDFEEEFDADIFTGFDFQLTHSADAEEENAPAAEEEKKAEEDEKLTEEPAAEPESKTESESKTASDDSTDSKNEELQHKEEPTMAEAAKEKTVQEVFENEFTDEQKQIVYAMLAVAVENALKKAGTAEHSDENSTEEDTLMHNNVFETNGETTAFDANAAEFFAHSEEVFADAKKSGSLKDAVIEHAATYGIDHIDYLFPDAKMLSDAPDYIKRDDSFVTEFMDRVHKSPFSRIKSVHANITEAAARAKGYIKGSKKANEVFKLLSRVTNPTTVYKHQALDRQDIIEARDFNVITFVKQEMRIMLDEEIVRAALVGDGRDSNDADHIDDTAIRPIWTDDDLYTVSALVSVAQADDEQDIAKKTINAIIRARKNYRGSGNPIFFTSEDVLTEMLLLEDGVGRPLYDDINKLATKLRVAKIVTSEIFEGLYRTVSDVRRDLVGIIVNPADYNFGADKGGEISLFDDFDIDYNQNKFLLEAHLSGALTKPYSAIAVEKVAANP
jgi:HK97 family phage prohead protease